MNVDCTARVPSVSRDLGWCADPGERGWGGGHAISGTTRNVRRWAPGSLFAHSGYRSIQRPAMPGVIFGGAPVGSHEGPGWGLPAIILNGIREHPRRTSAPGGI